jgi:hypothetical protein
VIKRREWRGATAARTSLSPCSVEFPVTPSSISDSAILPVILTCGRDLPHESRLDLLFFEPYTIGMVNAF